MMEEQVLMTLKFVCFANSFFLQQAYYKLLNNTVGLHDLLNSALMAQNLGERQIEMSYKITA